MKTGWYICDGTGQFPYRNIQSIQKPLFQTWTKWINILVNKYISDASLYWNVLLYIKYNTISFLFFVVLFLYTKYPKYTDTSLQVLEGLFFYSIRKRQFQLIILAKKKEHDKTKRHEQCKEKDLEQDEITSDISRHYFFFFTCWWFWDCLKEIHIVVVPRPPNLLKPKCCLNSVSSISETLGVKNVRQGNFDT